MLCDNCGKREANVRYQENINGRKKELNLCEECSQKLGINKIDFNMPIDFSSFFGGFFEEFENQEFMPFLNDVKTLTCERCGYTFDDIVKTGKLGCQNCYDIFEEHLNPIIKRIQGADTHVGRIGKIIDSKIVASEENEKKTEEKTKEQSKIEKLKEELKKAIEEEKYEEAAKLRDEIKKLEK